MIFYEKKVKMGLTGFTHPPQRDVAQHKILKHNVDSHCESLEK